MDYATIRCLHISCAAVSIALFSLRLLLSLQSVAWRRWAWLRIFPHVNDAVLLTAAITLATLSHQYPWAQPWLGAKVLLLLAYIGFGKMALKPGQPRSTQARFGAAALLTVLSIVALAVLRPAAFSI